MGCIKPECHRQTKCRVVLAVFARARSYTRAFAVLTDAPPGRSTAERESRVKKPVSKADLRADLERATERFLRKGGTVTAVPRGTSGNNPLTPQGGMSRRLFVEPREQRTLIPEVVAAIEERRKALHQRKPRPKRSRLPRPRRKTIYDDFGEPLRKVWVDD